MCYLEARLERRIVSYFCKVFLIIPPPDNLSWKFSGTHPASSFYFIEPSHVLW